MRRAAIVVVFEARGHNRMPSFLGTAIGIAVAREHSYRRQESGYAFNLSAQDFSLMKDERE
jgi:hypothetical protein